MQSPTSAFIDWGLTEYPQVFSAALEKTTAENPTDATFGGFFDDIGSGVGNFLTNFGSNLNSAASAYLTYQTDKTRIKINSDRAKAGCPPITDWNTPPPPCSTSLFGTKYNAQGQPIYGTGMSWGPILGIGALAVVGYVLVSNSRGGRRR